jgi:hypothetical protein
VDSELKDLLLEYIRANQSDHERIFEKLETLSVQVARVEENVLTQKRRWGMLATVATSAVVGFLVNFGRNMVK